MNRKDTFSVAAIVLVIALSIGAIVWSRSSHERSIREWARTHEYTVVSIERIGMFGNDSPWWRSKGDDLCRIIVNDGHQNRTAFSRQRFLGFEQKLKGD